MKFSECTYYFFIFNSLFRRSGATIHRHQQPSRSLPYTKSPRTHESPPSLQYSDFLYNHGNEFMTLLIDKEGAKFPSKLSKRFMQVHSSCLVDRRCARGPAGPSVSTSPRRRRIATTSTRRTSRWSSLR